MNDGTKFRDPVRATPVRLEAGSHRSPADGVCIVELASIIGGESFSDSPRCVDRVVAAEQLVDELDEPRLLVVVADVGLHGSAALRRRLDHRDVAEAGE